MNVCNQLVIDHFTTDYLIGEMRRFGEDREVKSYSSTDLKLPAV